MTSGAGAPLRSADPLLDHLLLYWVYLTLAGGKQRGGGVRYKCLFGRTPCFSSDERRTSLDISLASSTDHGGPWVSSAWMHDSRIAPSIGTSLLVFPDLDFSLMNVARGYCEGPVIVARTAHPRQSGDRWR